METLLQTERSALKVQNGFLSTEQWKALSAHALTLPLQTEQTFPLFNRDNVMHRCVGFFSDVSNGYAYSGQKSDAMPLTDELRALLATVNEHCTANFNGILVNMYRTGEDYIGRHSDDERSLCPSAGVVALSLGAERTFRVRRKDGEPMDGGANFKDFTTRNGQLMQMCGDFQREFTHEVPPHQKSSRHPDLPHFSCS